MKTWAWALLLAIFARRDLLELVEKLRGSKPCFDAYKGILSIYSVDSLYPDFIPKLGMGHVTVAGVKHHGMKNFEVWLQTLAPGVATPIHSHPTGCEEINYVTRGSGLVKTLSSRSGKLVAAPISTNSTVIAPPGTVWMVENTGDEDLQVLVVIGCGRPGISVFDAWNASQPAVTLDVMTWNMQCPPPLSSDKLRVIT